MIEKVAPIAFDGTGLLSTAKPTMEQWLATNAQLEVVKDAHAWALGDLLLLADLWDLDLPDEVAKKAESTRVAYLATAKAFPRNVRDGVIEKYPFLTFSHFRAVKSLPTSAAIAWLHKAGENRWGKEELRAQLKPKSEPDYFKYSQCKMLWANHVGERFQIIEWRGKFFLANHTDKSLFEVGQVD